MVGGGRFKVNRLPAHDEQVPFGVCGGAHQRGNYAAVRVPFSQSALSDARGATLIFVLPTEGPFALDATTGNLVTAAPLDREQQHYYSITGEQLCHTHVITLLIHSHRIHPYTNENALNSSCLFRGRHAFNAQSTKVDQMLVERY